MTENKTNLKQKIKDQECIIQGLKYQLQTLQHKLDNYDSYQREKCCDCCKEAVIDLIEKDAELFELKEKIGKLIK